jgi:hypothetical protein
MRAMEISVQGMDYEWRRVEGFAAQLAQSTRTAFNPNVHLDKLDTHSPEPAPPGTEAQAMLQMMAASRSYEANLAALTTSREIYLKSLEIASR